MQLRVLKAVISVGAAALIAGRLLWPELKVDAITLGLLAFGMLPWLSPLIKSAELPGGFKIEFQDLKEAAERVTQKLLSATITGGGATTDAHAATRPSGRATTDAHSATGGGRGGALALPREPFEVRERDPNLVLVSVRIEIERRLRKLAERHQIRADLPLSRITSELRQAGVLDSDEAGGLADLITMGNQAAHGAQVSADAAAWARTYAADVIDALEAKLSESTPGAA